MLKIDGNKMRNIIKNSGLSNAEVAKILDIPLGTLSAWQSKNRMQDTQLEKICLLLRVEREELILPDAPEEKAEKEAPHGSDMLAEITSINDAMASLVRMMETTMNTVKRISDEVLTIKDTEYTASQESKRFYQEGHVTFKTIVSWIKAGWKQ